MFGICTFLPFYRSTICHAFFVVKAWTAPLVSIELLGMCGLLFWPFKRIGCWPNLKLMLISFGWFLPELVIEGWRELTSVVRLGSLEPYPEEPLVVVVALDGKNLPCPFYLYWVWFILIWSSWGFLIDSARLTTKLGLIWYRSGETLCFMPRVLLIISNLFCSTHLVLVIDDSIRSDLASSC